MRGIRILSTSAVFLATVHCGIAQADWPSNPNVNLPICTAVQNQVLPTIVSDGEGGAIITWYDHRNGTNNDIYAQRVNLAGVPQWTADGVALCTAAGDQDEPKIASDGAGGAIITWYDYRNGTNNVDIYAQRVNAAGVPQWPANGVALCTAANDQFNPAIAPDGAGGAIVAWDDARSATNRDIYAQNVRIPVSATSVSRSHCWTPRRLHWSCTTSQDAASNHCRSAASVPEGTSPR